MSNYTRNGLAHYMIETEHTGAATNFISYNTKRCVEVTNKVTRSDPIFRAMVQLHIERLGV